jgi:hypothetical protein
VIGLLFFWIKAMKVAFRDLSMDFEDLDSSTTSQIYFPIIFQNLWKKSVVNPSSMGAFPKAISFTIFSTYSMVDGLIRKEFFLGFITFGMLPVIFWISLSMSPSSLVKICWKFTYQFIFNAFEGIHSLRGGSIHGIYHVLASTLQ